MLEVIKADIMGVFHDFHASSKFEKSLNATFISLIPKKTGAIDLKDFCPMVNDTPSGFFGSSRSLRQGDPLSPSLCYCYESFNLVE
jgi:hypothetical protein